jgi:protease-4
MESKPNPPSQPSLDAAAIIGAEAMPQRTPAGQDSPAPPPQRIVVHHTGGLLMKIALWLGWAGFFMCGLLLIGQMALFSDYFDTSGGITEKFHSGAEYASDKVAIIDVSGVIVDGEGFVKHQIDRVRDDDSVKAIVVRVDSPGGTVTGSDYIYHHLKKLRDKKKIPVVVSMGGMAASGGYYVSMAVGDEGKSIYAEPTTTTGSIGVIIPHYDISGLLANYDVKDDSIVSHPRKQMLSITRPINEEHREILQGYVNEAFERFSDIVKEGRPVFRKDPDALQQLATGEIFSATKAKKFGLIDEIGFIEDAIDRAIELAKLDKDDVRVIRYKAPASLLDLSSLAQSRSSGMDLSTLLDQTAPRAYYLCTSLPPLISNRDPK